MNLYHYIYQHLHKYLYRNLYYLVLILLMKDCFYVFIFTIIYINSILMNLYLAYELYHWKPVMLPFKYYIIKGPVCIYFVLTKLTSCKSRCPKSSAPYGFEQVMEAKYCNHDVYEIFFNKHYLFIYLFI